MEFNVLSSSNIDPNLCTHIIVGFASVSNCTIDLGKNLSIYSQIVRLKETSPNLKVLLSVGGADNESGFPQMVSNHANRKVWEKFNPETIT